MEDIVENSGYSLHTSFPELFRVTQNELSQNEILFTVRFTSGGLGLGSSLATYFAPKGYLASQSQNHNWPTGDLEAILYKTASDSATDTRYCCHNRISGIEQETTSVKNFLRMKFLFRMMMAQIFQLSVMQMFY